MSRKWVFGAIIALFVLCSTAFAGEVSFKVGEVIRDSDVKVTGLYPVLRLSSTGGGPAALVYATMSNSRFERIFVFRDWDNGKLEVKDAFSLADLKYERVLSRVENAPVVGTVNVLSARLLGLSPSGTARVSLKVLRDATAVFRSPTAEVEIVLVPRSNEAAAYYDGSEVFSIVAVPRRLGKYMVGVSKLRFYAPNGQYQAEAAL